MIYNIKIIFISNLMLLLFTSGFLIKFLKREIIIDNQLKIDKEDNIDYSEYSTDVKPIAIYKPNIIRLDIKNGQINNNSSIYEQLKRHINLAKSHGIYGFAFYFPFFDANISYSPLDLILQNKNIKIYFCLILTEKIKSDRIYFNLSLLFENIKKYIEDERYIKFNNKYVIGTTDNIFSKNISIFISYYPLINFDKKNAFEGDIIVWFSLYH